VNVVGHKNGGLMKPFWNPDNKEPFDGLETILTERGNLMLPLAMAALECELRSASTPGDHEIIFAEVVDGRLLQSDDKPLTHVRKSASGY
jgi:flavin reductase (DIM6/NTAB) family NADH-FMN oxidoreductase RutF